MIISELIIPREWGVEIKYIESYKIFNENYFEIIELAMKTCKLIGKKRILFDLTLHTQKVDILKLHRTLTLMHQYMGSGGRIANITPDLMPENNVLLVENNGYLRGVFILYFPNRDKAMNWLLS